MSFKDYYRKNPVLFWLTYIFVVFNLIDAFTALFILPGEANPLYLAVGNIWLLMPIKLGFMIPIIYFYNRNKFTTHGSYFFFCVVIS